MRFLVGLATFMTAAVASAETAPSFVEDAIRQTLNVSGAHIVIQSYRPTLQQGCIANSATAVAPPSTNGNTTLRLSGATSEQVPCEGWAQVRASISIPVLVTTKPVAMGAPLGDSVKMAERPWGVARHPVVELADGAVASESLGADTPVDARYVKVPGSMPGDPVTVVLQSGPITVTQSGHIQFCGEGHTCAALPSGRRVEGRLVGDQLVVEVL